MPRTPTLNIAHIVLSLEVGGLEKVVLTLATEQQKQGHKAVIVCLDKIGTLGESLSAKGITILCLKRKQSRLDINTVSKLRKILKENKIDIIHTHNVEANIYGMLSSILLSNIKSIHTQHGIPDNFSFIKQVYMNISGRMLGRFISVSDSAAQHAVKNHWVNKKKTEVIINGIDTDDFITGGSDKNTLRDKYNIPRNALILVTVSRIEAVKDHATMIEQFSIAASNKQYLHLIIVGDGSLKNNIEKLVDQKSLRSFVTLTGMQTGVKDYLQLADIFIMTSISEGISISLLEAMSTGLIPLVTPVGGNTQIVAEHESGYFIDITAPDSLKKTINTIETSDTLRQEISDNARKKVIENFSKDVMIEKYMQHYEALLS